MSKAVSYSLFFLSFIPLWITVVFIDGKSLFEDNGNKYTELISIILILINVFIFLGLFYIYLLYQYNYGKIHFIPAYFNMENEDIFNKIQDGSTYALAVKQTFSAFVNKIEEIARVKRSRCAIS